MVYGNRSITMEKTTVYIPTEIKMSIKASAKRQGATEAHVILEALAAYVESEPRELPSVFGSVRDGSLSAANYEDWLVENWDPDW
jgi:predicted DNA-binding protein